LAQLKQFSKSLNQSRISTQGTSDGQIRDYERIKIGVTAPVNRAPSLVPIGSKTAVVGSLLQFTVSAIDLDGDQITYTAYSLPSGASFNSATREFSWTPTSSGSYYIYFYASDVPCVHINL